MRKLVIVPLVSGLLCNVAVVSADEYCSNKTLEGSYIFSAVGSDGKVPTAYAGMEFFDGDGHVTIVAKYSDNSNTSLKGVNRVTKNCRVEIAYKGGRTATLFLTPSGDGFAYVITSGPTLASIARRISKDNLIGIKP